MDSRSILYSRGRNDECETPAYGVKPIIKYIPHGAVVWCPFDKAHSQFVELISKTHRVVYSHVDEGRDFYVYEPDHWDVIVSNPPFTNKRKIFERALSFGKPFALLMTNTWLNDAAPVRLFLERQLQLLMFDKRIEYLTKYKAKRITFGSSYYCCDFLPRDLITEELELNPNPACEGQCSGFIGSLF